MARHFKPLNLKKEDTHEMHGNCCTFKSFRDSFNDRQTTALTFAVNLLDSIGEIREISLSALSINMDAHVEVY